MFYTLNLHYSYIALYNTEYGCDEMIKYPNGSKKQYSSIAKNTSNRGMTLESEINLTNEFYLEQRIAVIHKKPTPVTIVKVDYPARNKAKITEAYFKVPSTTDYNGIYKGKYIDFEAKECASLTSFPIKSIHAHQIKHLKAVHACGAISFIIIRFTKHNETYYVDSNDMIEYIETCNRSSIPYAWFVEHGTLIPYNYVKPVDYITVINERYIKE